MHFGSICGVEAMIISHHVFGQNTIVAEACEGYVFAFSYTKKRKGEEEMSKAKQSLQITTFIYLLAAPCLPPKVSRAF